MSLKVTKIRKFDYSIRTLLIEEGKLRGHLRDLNRFMEIEPEGSTADAIITNEKWIKEIGEAIELLKEQGK